MEHVLGKHSIYSLRDPRTDDVRYVGASYYPPDVRLADHIREAMNYRWTPKAKWVYELLELGLRPTVEILEAAIDLSVAADRERCWVNYYRDQGAPLTNKRGGGSGIVDPRGPAYWPRAEKEREWVRRELAKKLGAVSTTSSSD